MKFLYDLIAVLYTCIIILPAALFAAILAFYEVCKVLPNEVFQKFDELSDKEQ